MKTSSQNTTYIDHVAPGTIAMWSGPQNTIPQGWYICNGATITQDGKPFTLPDLTNRFAQGSPDDAHLGELGGANQLSLTIDNMPKDWPSISDPGHGHGSHLPFEATFLQNSIIPSGNELINPGKGASPGFGVTVDANVTGITIPDQGKGVAFDNRPAYYALYYIMKV